MDRGCQIAIREVTLEFAAPGPKLAFLLANHTQRLCPPERETAAVVVLQNHLFAAFADSELVANLGDVALGGGQVRARFSIRSIRERIEKNDTIGSHRVEPCGCCEARAHPACVGVECLALGEHDSLESMRERRHPESTGLEERPERVVHGFKKSGMESDNDRIGIVGDGVVSGTSQREPATELGSKARFGFGVDRQRELRRTGRSPGLSPRAIGRARTLSARGAALLWLPGAIFAPCVRAGGIGNPALSRSFADRR